MEAIDTVVSICSLVGAVGAISHTRSKRAGDTASTHDDTERSETVTVTWNDANLQSRIGTSDIPSKFLSEQQDGVFKTKCTISVGNRGIVPEGAICTSNTLTSLITVAVTWTDSRLQSRIGPYDMPEQYLAKLRDGVYRTTSKLTVSGRGTIPKGAICKSLYAHEATPPSTQYSYKKVMMWNWISHGSPTVIFKIMDTFPVYFHMSTCECYLLM